MSVHLALTWGHDPEGNSMIFSIGERQRITRSVELVCPRCGLDRTGVEAVPSRWGCVFGRPVVSLGEQDPVIICNVCSHTSDTGVLDVPTTSQLAILLRDATLAALVLAVRSGGGRAGANSLHAAEMALRETGFDPGEVAFESSLADLTDGAARHSIRCVGCELTAYGKQGFLRRVAAVISTSEPITQEQRDTLVQIGCDLRMAVPHINGILAVAAIAA